MSTLRSYMPARGVLRPRLSPIDVGVLVAVLVLLYAVLQVGHGATATFNPAGLQHVSTNAARLPYDALRSVARMFIALCFSVAFTLAYGYAAARSRRAEKILVPILDILQSVPVLGFLTITVTAFIALFPGSALGLECASIFAIFTAQAWNMTFSFYASVKNMPRELDELSRSLRLTRWQRFWKLEVPSGAIGLVWNGMMSFGGSWFFLVASEAISLHNHTYSLPGVGSFVGAAIARGELGTVGLAIATMIVMVVAVNVLFWRPLVAFCERYRYESTEAGEAPRSFVLDVLARSSWARLVGRSRSRVAEWLARAMRILGRDD
ncbi:MAG TPA: ABC transporter permease subunit, partial [Solirubrobacteraceae bacterium]|nr:ABC transporter permease subunit [Solirubrobacteraceae bacterium]